MFAYTKEYIRLYKNIIFKNGARDYWFANKLYNILIFKKILFIQQRWNASCFRLVFTIHHIRKHFWKYGANHVS
jgi:hypothetical protein